MEHSSPYRFVFWVLLILLAAIAAALVYMTGFGLLGIPMDLASLLPLIALGVLYFSVVAILVYRDAARRGLDPWLWATVAAFLPYLIGVILYLVLRANGGSLCLSCGHRRSAAVHLCPYCGSEEDRRCPGCRRPVGSDWQICPFCRHDLTTSPPGT